MLLSNRKVCWRDSATSLQSIGSRMTTKVQLDALSCLWGANCRTYECEGSSRVFRARWQTVDEHVGLRSNDGRVDEAKEEETSDQRTDRVICRFRVFPLCNKPCQSGERRRRGKRAVTHFRQATDLFTDPPDSVRDAINTVHNRQEKRVRDLHQHGQSRRDDVLNVWVRCSDFWGHVAREVFGKFSSFVLNRVDHLLVHLPIATSFS